MADKRKKSVTKRIKAVPEEDRLCGNCKHASPIEGKSKIQCENKLTDVYGFSLQITHGCGEWEQ